MLRISEIKKTNGSVTLALEGRMSGPWVTEVREYCQQFLGNGHRLSLDLAQLSYVDREGADLFRMLLSHGVALTNCTPFVSERLKVGTPTHD